MKVMMKKREVSADGQNALSQAVKNVKEILKTKNKEVKIERKKVTKVLKRKKKNRDQKDLGRGIVYIGHVPHGFYEDQIRDYFSQFGTVLRVRLSRSKVTGKSRGYGYVEFLDPEVAKIAAETMNNYLMCGRLLKATYISPEKQHNGFFTKRHWSRVHYPRKLNRIKEIKKFNSTESKHEHAAFVKKSLNKLTKLSKKLEEQGIELEFPISSEKR